MSGHREFLVAIERDANGSFRLAREFDCCDRIDTEARLRPEPAANMVGDDAYLAAVEFVSLGDKLHHVENRLCRDVEREAIAIEVGHGRMRFEAGMRLTRSAEGLFDQKRIMRISCCGDGAAHQPGLVGKRRRWAAYILFPGCR